LIFEKVKIPFPVPQRKGGYIFIFGN